MFRHPHAGNPRPSAVDSLVRSVLYSMTSMRLALASCSVPLLVLAASCVSEAPVGLRPTPSGTGARVTFEPFAQPVAILPLPNDVATWPDPGSPTGLRLNVSMVAPTAIESHARALLDSLDGWSTYGAIAVPFDGPLDVRGLLASFRDDAGVPDHDPRDDALYLVDLTTGLPVPLDLGDGNFPLVLDDPYRYYPNDPRAGASNLLFETVDEAALGDDTDFDGKLDRPNLLDFDGDGLGIDPADQADDLATFWEVESNTLIVRPIVPLEQRRRYAVVLTRRLRDAGGEPVRSPFDFIAHVEQTEALAPLADQLAARPDLYGDLAIDDVAFAWTFTTETVTEDLRLVNMGLHGEGPLAPDLADFPIEAIANEARGGGRGCEPVPDNPYVVSGEEFQGIVETIAPVLFGIGSGETEALLSSYAYVDHVLLMTFTSPSLLDQDSGSFDALWDVDTKAGRAQVGQKRLTVWVTIPKVRPGAEQPFPVAFYAHGYTLSGITSLGFAGSMARWGIATVGLDAAGHGLALDAGFEEIARSVFTAQCLGPAADPILHGGRARDLTGDGVGDSGGDFFTAYVFHTRDMLRQTAVDYAALVRTFQAFDGTRRGTQDFDGDGVVELFGDFDADGVPDLGGEQPVLMWGHSLGGITSMLVGASDPAFVAVAPSVGGAGLGDIALRSGESGVKEAAVLRLVGPLLLGAVVETGDGDAPTVPIEYSPGEATHCAVGETSLWWIVPDANRTGVVEAACASTIEDGDVVIAKNLSRDEVRCARAGQVDGVDDRRFRLGLPSNVDDLVEVSVFDASDVPTDFVFGDDCRMPAGVAPKEILDSYGADARFQGRTFAAGDPLTSPVEGYGFFRQSVDLRRFAMLGQAALDPADPANWARHFFLDPIDFGRRGAPARNVFDAPTVGDIAVPVATGIAFARIAGLLPFLPSDSPWASVYPEYVATPEVEAAYGGRTPNQVLLDHHVMEGVARLERFASVMPDDPQALFDPCDLDDDTDGWDAPSLPREGLPPLRPVVHTPGTAAGLSAFAMPYIDSHGAHAFILPEPSLPFDVHTYMTNLFGLWLSSHGERVLYDEDPAGHRCLADSSCPFIAPPP